ncbi:hypothetical protein E6C76_08010 [Pseudothauera nasutitermitis]|uniref:EF-hand domain-containing protein n=1 Tax=Pseudothauera nasutitermitis TaxID=2565930 RepID=A0A4S4AZC2_9RHOO|nr:hypothetical protein [Pseudothauera nasutitermitis]THF65518.1 hypothetical protein E6C76_08010 [Pseudothauera nasutitermitis]
MLVRLRTDLGEIGVPMAQMVLFVAALGIGHGPGMLGIFALLIATAFFGWLRSIRHARLIADTPTARVASAAQGYTELRGRGRPLGGTPLRSPIDGLPVLWYRVVTRQRGADGKWRHLRSEESDASFLLDDGSGLCAVAPEGAEMLVRRHDRFQRGNLRHAQWALIDQDPIYVLGEFSTLGSISPALDTPRQVGELLEAWKREKPTLLARFDLNGDGQIDLKEWELARAQARREVLRQQRELLAAPEAHVMRKPEGKRLYLISDIDPARIARRYRRWALFHLAVLLGAAAGAGWFARMGAFQNVL